MSALFDPYAELAKIQKSGCTPATIATFATNADLKASQPQPRGDICRNVANVARVLPQNRVSGSQAQSDGLRSPDMRHGFTIGGRALTWTGKVVRLEDWRHLTEWDKHGPDGRRWNALTQDWEKPDE